MNIHRHLAAIVAPVRPSGPYRTSYVPACRSTYVGSNFADLYTSLVCTPVLFFTCRDWNGQVTVAIRSAAGQYRTRGDPRGAQRKLAPSVGQFSRRQPVGAISWLEGRKKWGSYHFDAEAIRIKHGVQRQPIPAVVLLTRGRSRIFKLIPILEPHQTFQLLYDDTNLSRTIVVLRVTPKDVSQLTFHRHFIAVDSYRLAHICVGKCWWEVLSPLRRPAVVTEAPRDRVAERQYSGLTWTAHPHSRNPKSQKADRELRVKIAHAAGHQITTPLFCSPLRGLHSCSMLPVSGAKPVSTSR